MSRLPVVASSLVGLVGLAGLVGLPGCSAPAPAPAKTAAGEPAPRDPDLRCGVDDEPPRGGTPATSLEVIEGQELVDPGKLDHCTGTRRGQDAGDSAYRVVLSRGSTPIGMSRIDGRPATAFSRCLLSVVCATRTTPSAPREVRLVVRDPSGEVQPLSVNAEVVGAFPDKFAKRLLEQGLVDAVNACGAGHALSTETKLEVTLTLATLRSLRDLRRVTQVVHANVRSTVGPDVEECVRKRLDEMRWGDLVRPDGDVPVTLRARVTG